MTDNANIVSLFIDAAANNAAGKALIQDGISITYGQLLGNVKATAAHYRSKGIGKGDKVLVFVPMSVDLYIVVLALLYIGVTPVFIDEWVSIDRLKACCRTVPCQGMIASGRLLWLSWFIKDLRQIPIKIKAADTGGKDTDAELTTVSSEDTALITFTTGSTGTPKAANRTHAYLHSQFNALRHLVDNDASVSLITLPVVTLINLALGKTTVLPGRGFAVKKQHTSVVLKNDIVNNAVDEIITSPAILEDIAGHLSADDSSGRIWYVTTGGGAVFPQLAKKVIGCFVNAKCTVVYGSTEAEPISEIGMHILSEVPADTILQHGLPVGSVHHETDVAILKVIDIPIAPKDFEAHKLPCTETGEIVVSGNHVLKSYINNEEAILRNKIPINNRVWHRTGDAGCVDEYNNLFLKGRCNEIIHHNKKVYYPLLVTYTFEQYTNCSAALLLYGAELVLVVESQDKINNGLLVSVLRKLQIEDATVRYIKQLPRDPRHRTKVDYEKLKTIRR